MFGGKVFMGGSKGIVYRAANALGVGAKIIGKSLGIASVIKHGSSSFLAFRNGDPLTGWHDGAKAVLSFLGVTGQKYVTIAGEAIDTASKIYGAYSTQ
jgi:hypothetical protein